MTIKFINNNLDQPYINLRHLYGEALSAKQESIQALAISSYNKTTSEVSSRFVNLKFIDDEKFIFFTNYKSPKSLDFANHAQISALIYWPAINTQIRFKANIKKLGRQFNKEYFISRSDEKNALAISSNQSNEISSFQDVKTKYKHAFETEDLSECPDYWGGFSFKPYQIEFWKGDSFRLNKRDLYTRHGNGWRHAILEP